MSFGRQDQFIQEYMLKKLQIGELHQWQKQTMISLDRSVKFFSDTDNLISQNLEY